MSVREALPMPTFPAAVTLLPLPRRVFASLFALMTFTVPPRDRVDVEDEEMDAATVRSITLTPTRENRSKPPLATVTLASSPTVAAALSSLPR